MAWFPGILVDDDVYLDRLVTFLPVEVRNVKSMVAVLRFESFFSYLQYLLQVTLGTVIESFAYYFDSILFFAVRLLKPRLRAFIHEAIFYLAMFWRIWRDI
jgi:hypothetical protein